MQKKPYNGGLPRAISVADLTIRACSYCREVKQATTDFFFKCSRDPRGVGRECKACSAERSKRRSANPEYDETRRANGRRAQTKQRALHPEKMKARNLRQHIARKESGKYLERRLRTKYNLTVEQFHGMWEAQRGLCGLCDSQMKKQDGTSARADRDLCVVDHDHETGVVRGLLCHGCNMWLGKTEQCPRRLDRAASWLVRGRIRDVA